MSNIAYELSKIKWSWVCKTEISNFNKRGEDESLTGVVQSEAKKEGKEIMSTENCVQ